MDLLEYEGKQLFARHDLPLPDRRLYTGDDIDLPDWQQTVVKAQVPAGKREEHGGIIITNTGDALQEAEKMLGTTIQGEQVDAVLLEEKASIQQELYISLSINRADKGYHLVFSEQGGSGIEEVAETDPDAIHVLDFYEFDRQTLEEELDATGFDQAAGVAAIAEKMYRLLREEDALLVEINPLAVTPNGLLALDSKVRLDENALYRHDFQFQHEGQDGLEAAAEKAGLEFVDLDGSIAVIGNGAGLVMATLDSINHFGGRPADFLDIGGGADFEKMKKAMDIAMQQESVNGVFINIFGGITRCDEVAQGIIDFVESRDMEVPLVV
ncbi:MAG: ATP-grasp domain-containing protein, partial [Candidatus Nanohaloarchaea archaeon]|nr:ATP-grasp domain-containing protein [Candidatus Nanohaloarchaea archaeon]